MYIDVAKIQWLFTAIYSQTGTQNQHNSAHQAHGSVNWHFLLHCITVELSAPRMVIGCRMFSVIMWDVARFIVGIQTIYILFRWGRIAYIFHCLQLKIVPMDGCGYVTAASDCSITPLTGHLRMTSVLHCFHNTTRTSSWLAIATNNRLLKESSNSSIQVKSSLH